MTYSEHCCFRVYVRWLEILLKCANMQTHFLNSQVDLQIANTGFLMVSRIH